MTNIAVNGSSQRGSCGRTYKCICRWYKHLVCMYQRVIQVEQMPLPTTSLSIWQFCSGLWLATMSAACSKALVGVGCRIRTAVATTPYPKLCIYRPRHVALRSPVSGRRVRRRHFTAKTVGAEQECVPFVLKAVADVHAQTPTLLICRSLSGTALPPVWLRGDWLIFFLLTPGRGGCLCTGLLVQGLFSRSRIHSSNILATIMCLFVKNNSFWYFSSRQFSSCDYEPAALHAGSFGLIRQWII